MHKRLAWLQHMHSMAPCSRFAPTFKRWDCVTGSTSQHQRQSTGQVSWGTGLMGSGLCMDNPSGFSRQQGKIWLDPLSKAGLYKGHPRPCQVLLSLLKIQLPLQSPGSDLSPAKHESKAVEESLRSHGQSHRLSVELVIWWRLNGYRNPSILFQPKSSCQRRKGPRSGGGCRKLTFGEACCSLREIKTWPLWPIHPSQAGAVIWTTKGSVVPSVGSEAHQLAVASGSVSSSRW